METEAFQFLNQNKPQLCVLATVNESGKPECAVLAYAVQDDLSLIISTHSTSRKWHNLAHNDKVAVTVGWNFTTPNIQYEGIAQRIQNSEEHTVHEKIYFLAHPELGKYKGPDTVFIKITPKWIRYTDFSTQPPKSTEKLL